MYFVMFFYIFLLAGEISMLYFWLTPGRGFSSVFLLPIINNITAKTESNIECVILKLVPNKKKSIFIRKSIV